MTYSRAKPRPPGPGIKGGRASALFSIKVEGLVDADCQGNSWMFVMDKIQAYDIQTLVDFGDVFTQVTFSIFIYEQDDRKWNFLCTCG